MSEKITIMLDELNLMYGGRVGGLLTLDSFQRSLAKSIFGDIAFRRDEKERFTYKSLDYGWLIDKKNDDEPDWMKKYPKKKQVPAYLLKLVERIDIAADKGFEARRKLLAESDFS